MGNGTKPFVWSSISLARAALTSSMSPPSRGDVGKCSTGAGSVCSPLIRSKAVAVREGVAFAGFSMSWHSRIISMTVANE